MWPYRTNLSNNKMFGAQTKVEAGLRWSEYGRLTASKLRTPLSLAFPEVATHNHFVLDRGGKVFKQTAPVIKLSRAATEEQHLALVGVLNSSTACFWMKQKSHDKGNGGYGGGIADQEWERFFVFTSTTMREFPLSSTLPQARGAKLDCLAQALTAARPDRLALKTRTRERTATTRRLVLAVSDQGLQRLESVIAEPSPNRTEQQAFQEIRKIDDIGVRDPSRVVTGRPQDPGAVIVWKAVLHPAGVLRAEPVPLDNATLRKWFSLVISAGTR